MVETGDTKQFQEHRRRLREAERTSHQLRSSVYLHQDSENAGVGELDLCGVELEPRRLGLERRQQLLLQGRGVRDIELASRCDDDLLVPVVRVVNGLQAEWSE